MIYIFFETNFFLRLALKQEKYQLAFKLLRLAEQKKIKLVFPSFCISEAYGALFKKIEVQRKIKNNLDQFIEQTKRSGHMKSSIKSYTESSQNIAKKTGKELTFLDVNIKRVLKIAESIEHTAIVQQNGVKFRSSLDIKNEPDAFIISAVDYYVKTKLPPNSQAFFITSDEKSLGNKPEVKNLMRRRKIKLYTSLNICIGELKRNGII